MFCVGGRHRSSRISIKDDITETCRNSKFGEGVHCNKKKSVIGGDNTVAAERLGRFFRFLGRTSAKAGKNVASVSKSPKAALSPIPNDQYFYHTGMGFYCGEYV